MQFNETTRKYILLGVVIFIVIGLLSAKAIAKKQDNEFLTEDLMYQQASQLSSEGNFEEASKHINDLLLKQPNSEMANYFGGIIAANKRDFKQSTILLQKTLDINPYKVEDAIFMLQFGEALFFAERYEDAKIVLEKCREGGWAPESYPSYQERINELLTQTENMLQGR